MPELLPLILILLAAYAWQAALRSRERARALGRTLCQRANVQLLDETVALQRLRFERGSNGWLRLLRRYRFELSTDGTDRHCGTLDILGGSVVGFSLPQLEPATGVVVNDGMNPCRLPPRLH
ncbi:MAG TPA: DUF3301 domain-containing protein [Rudaea sp.]|nr:DUF3301 domain-containing protein [Rudaea sp.]